MIEPGKGVKVEKDSGKSLEWISGTEPTNVKLADGTYVLHEDAAPNGYLVATDITFVIEDGKVVSMNDEAYSEAEIVMVDMAIVTTSTTATTTTSTTEATRTTSHGGQVLPGHETATTTRHSGDLGYDDDTRTRPTSTATEANTSEVTTTVLANIYISKQDIYSTEIVGAELTLTGVDENGNVIEFFSDDVIFGNGASFISDGTELRWTSGNEATFVKNLPDGTYTLHEEAAPDGYEVATDIVFTINNGKLAGKQSDTVVMVDTRAGDIKISKQNIFSDEIVGAELTLTGKDSDGNDIVFNVENIIAGNDAELLTTEDGTILKWKSGSTPTFVINLPNGIYTLHEDAAPSGYMVATDITFTIEDGKLSGEVGVTSDSVTMIDDMYLTDVNISKENTFGTEIAGATLTLTGTDLTGRTVDFSEGDMILGEGAKFLSDGNSLTWVSGTTPTLIKNLPDGTYTLHEIAAPHGYKVATDITFTIVNGELSGEVGVTSDSVTMMDDMIKTDVAISKQNVFSTEISGATLTLMGTDFTGKTVEFRESDMILGEGAKFVSDGDTLTWISGTTSTLIKNLPDGTYTLHEIAAPHGYAVATDITFTIENGEVKGEVGVTSDSVTMIDDMVKTDVAISKQNVFSTEISGATLTLMGTDFTGKTVEFRESDMILGEGAKFVSDGDTLTWISGTTSTLIKNLPDGTYTLHEIAAPHGYAVATDITFTIENGEVKGEVGVTSDSVTMVDDMLPESTVTTEGGTTTTTTGSSTKKSTTKTTAKTTITTKSDSPKTGDAGMALPFVVIVLAAGTAFAFRKKRQ